jgi:hypothetical protein
MEAKKIPGVPEQKGAFHDTESQKTFIVSELAAQQFGILKERFFFYQSLERLLRRFIFGIQAL